VEQLGQFDQVAPGKTYRLEFPPSLRAPQASHKGGRTGASWGVPFHATSPKRKRVHLI